MDVGILLEGQDGLTWARWKKMAQACADAGYFGLFRSDHFTHDFPPDRETLELWTSLTWLADRIPRLEFGPMVTPVSFRHPHLTARMAAAVDELAGGRLVLGLGAGWQVREHQMFGLELLPLRERMDRFSEAVRIIRDLLRAPAPVNFQGTYYCLSNAILLPRPGRRIPLLIGGNGPQRTLPIAAEFADEWNAVYVPAAYFAQLNAHLDSLLEKLNRPPGAVVRSLMTLVVCGRTEAEVEAKLRSRGMYRQRLRRSGILVGTPDDIRAQMEEFQAAGVQRLVLKWLDLDDLDSLAALGRAVVP